MDSEPIAAKRSRSERASSSPTDLENEKAQLTKQIEAIKSQVLELQRIESALKEGNDRLKADSSSPIYSQLISVSEQFHTKTLKMQAELEREHQVKAATEYYNEQLKAIVAQRSRELSHVTEDYYGSLQKYTKLEASAKVLRDENEHLKQRNLAAEIALAIDGKTIRESREKIEKLEKIIKIQSRVLPAISAPSAELIPSSLGAPPLPLDFSWDKTFEGENRTEE
jgi:chromosome segregation ATPase